MRIPRLVLFLAAAAAFGIPFTIFPLQTVFVSGAAKERMPAAPGGFLAVRSRSVAVPENLGEVKLTLRAGGHTFELQPVEAPKGVPQQVWAVVPEGVPLGAANVEVALGQSTSVEPVTLAATAPGIFTANYDGYGPAIATNTSHARIGLTTPAAPGDEVALYVTGLAGAGTSDVSVEIAGQPATVVAAAAQTDFRGLDQVNFIVPQDAFQGCYVPVQLRVRGVVSNVATLAISSTAGTCNHPFGLSQGELQAVDEGGSVRLAGLHVTSSYSNNGTWSWREGVKVDFPFADASQLYRVAGPQMPDTQLLGCGVDDMNLSVPFLVDNPDAGAAMTFAGPRSRGLSLPSLFYTSEAPPLEAPFFTPGAWLLTAPGGADVPAFTHSLTVPPPPLNPNIRHGQRFPLGQDLTISWNGAGYSGNDLAVLRVGGGIHYYNGKEVYEPILVCRERARVGRITIPWNALEPLSRVPFVGLTVMPDPAARRITKLTRTDGTPLTVFSDYQLTHSAQIGFE